MRNELVYLKRFCYFDVCLGRIVSFEFGLGLEWMKNFCMRWWSILVLVYGVMLLKVVFELYFGFWVMKGLFKVGLVEIILGEEVLWVREYVFWKIF